METTCTSPFFKVLPLECRDLIYKYAHCDREEACEVVARKPWVKRMNDSVSFGKSELRPFPQNPLADLIVSHRYYDEAGAAWFRNVSIQFGSEEELPAFLRLLSPCHRDSITKLNIYWLWDWSHGNDELRTLLTLPELKRLCLTIGRHVFHPCDDKVPTAELLVEKDFRQMGSMDVFIRLPILTVIDLIPDATIMSISGRRAKGETNYWCDNVKALSTYIQERRLQAIARKEELARQRTKEEQEEVFHASNEESEVGVNEPSGNLSDALHDMMGCDGGQQEDLEKLLRSTQPSIEPKRRLQRHMDKANISLMLSVIAVALSSAALALMIQLWRRQLEYECK